MPTDSGKKYGLLILVIAGVVASDQITKALVLAKLPLYRTIEILPGFFNLTHIHNPGGAFGFLAGSRGEWQVLFFLVFAVLAIGLVFYFYRRTPLQTHAVLAVGFALIMGGAIGNLVDRLRFGKVVDFLDFHLMGRHWPAFNLADSAITVGMIIFVYHLLVKKLPE